MAAPNQNAQAVLTALADGYVTLTPAKQQAISDACVATADEALLWELFPSLPPLPGVAGLFNRAALTTEQRSTLFLAMGRGFYRSVVEAHRGLTAKAEAAAII